MISSLSRPGFLHRTWCNGFFFELLTFHLDEFQSGGLAANPVEVAETQPKSSLRSLPICRKPLCLFPLGAVCVNLFSGEGITPASLAQLCCPSGTVSSFDADFSLFLYFLVCFSKGIKYVPYSNKSSEGHFQCAFSTLCISFSSRNSEHYLLFP